MPIMARMSALRHTSSIGLAGLLAGLAILLVCGLATARGATVTVAPGDTLGAIAARHGTSVDALARANGIADPARIRAGARLTVPGGGGIPTGMSPVGGAYTVRAGDTLGAIAARHGTTVGALAGANGISDPALIRAGARLTIPGGSSAPAAPAAAPAFGASGSHTAP